MSGSATYLYCLVRSAKAPALSKAKGLAGAGKPRAIDAGGSLWLVVSDAPLSLYGEGPISAGLKNLEWVSACAMAHEAAVEAAAKSAGALVPTKLFTLFSSDARALEHVNADRARLDRVLDRVAGRAEFGVRVTFDEARALRDAAAGAKKSAGPPATGAGFLQRKKQAQETVREVAGRARASMDDLFDRLAAPADDARRRAPEANVLGGPRLMLDAAFLVRSKSVARFKKEASAIAKELRPRGYELSVTGPWPPYNFISDDAGDAPRARGR